MLFNEGLQQQARDGFDTPISRPPISAPDMLPMPPTMTITKASRV